MWFLYLSFFICNLIMSALNFSSVPSMNKIISGFLTFNKTYYEVDWLLIWDCLVIWFFYLAIFLSLWPLSLVQRWNGMLLLNSQTSQQWPQTNGGNGMDIEFYVMTRCPTRGPPWWTGAVSDPCALTHRITYRNSFIIINILQKDVFHIPLKISFQRIVRLPQEITTRL